MSSGSLYTGNRINPQQLPLLTATEMSSGSLLAFRRFSWEFFASGTQETESIHNNFYDEEVGKIKDMFTGKVFGWDASLRSRKNAKILTFSLTATEMSLGSLFHGLSWEFLGSRTRETESIQTITPIDCNRNWSRRSMSPALPRRLWRRLKIGSPRSTSKNWKTRTGGSRSG
jgi:hypothetical protein